MVRSKYILAKYSQTGHFMYPEETWSDEVIIHDEDDLYRFMVEIHKTNARMFNDYPLVGECRMSCFSFSIQEVALIDGDCYLKSEKQPLEEKPIYFDAAKKRYTELVNRMKKTLPHLRKAQKRKQKVQDELETLKRLSAKYST